MTPSSPSNCSPSAASRPPKPRPTNFNEVVDHVAHLLKHSLAESVELAVEKSPNLPAVNADPVRWEQVLTNLCLNARDAIFQTRRHGVITVRTLAKEISPTPGLAPPRASRPVVTSNWWSATTVAAWTR